MFIPDKAASLAADKPYKHVGIQGHGGTGKTTSAMTFPNPVYIDIDNSVDLHNAQAVNVEPTTVKVLPFYDPEFYKNYGPNTRDSVHSFLEKNVGKFTQEQSLILDSWTFLQDAFDKQTEKEIPITKNGAQDQYYLWEKKQDYSRDILTFLKQAKCNVVVIFHEVKETDDKGRDTGKVTPLMQGKFVNKLHNYFPYIFRQICFAKITDEIKQKEEATKMGITLEQFRKAQEYSTDKSVRFWQCSTTQIAACKTKIPFARFVGAHFDVFKNPEPWLQK